MIQITLYMNNFYKKKNTNTYFSCKKDLQSK